MTTTNDEVMAFVREQESERAEKAIRANIGHVRHLLDQVEESLKEGGKVRFSPSGAILHLAEACGAYDAIISCTPREREPAK